MAAPQEERPEERLEERLKQIRNSPKLQSQQQTQLVLSAVEDTLRDQKSEFTPTAYFAALISLLGQFISTSKGIVNKDVATAVVYLLDLITPHVPVPLLRSKFSEILQNLATVLTHPQADAPILRPSIGCLESLLLCQDGAAWAQSQSQISPRRAVAGLLTMATDHRPKVRKRAREALAKVLQNGPPSPSLDHPAAIMCAETALQTLKDGVEATKKLTKGHKEHQTNAPNLIHTLQLIKTIAWASGGWPSQKIDSLCETLLNITKSSYEYLTMASFDVFEAMFNGMASEVSSAKLPHLLEVMADLQPSENDSQLLPPWIAVVSRGYDISSQVMPDGTFQMLPDIFNKIARFMSSMSHNIRVSAADCLISFWVNCVPASVVVNPSVYDEKILEKLAQSVLDLFSLKYQSAWVDTFRVLGATFDTLHWRATSLLSQTVKIIGELRTSDSFTGKKEADAVLSKAIRAMGPEAILKILPLNLATRTEEPGRVWLLPIMRDSISNTNLAHFKADLVPLSEKLYQKVIEHGDGEKTMEIKIYETIVNQIWSTFPGYCDLPIDLPESFDQKFAELISNVLYQQVDLRNHMCQGLQRLVESNRERIELSDGDQSFHMLRVSKTDAERNLKHLEQFASNLLAVLFNVYTQTLPQYRGPILQCINSYLSVTGRKDLVETFERVSSMLESSLAEANGTTAPRKPSDRSKEPQMPPMSHTLMDLVITISPYLPRESLIQLFAIASLMLKKDDPNLQKKAYKLIPRLADSETGKIALTERSEELQTLLLECLERTTPAARRDRLSALARMIEHLPKSDLHFIPSIIPEVTLATKETNEKARKSAYDLLVLMGTKMQQGGTIQRSKIPHMPSDSTPAPASLDEFFTLISAGLGGTAPHAISATITALTRVAYHFRHELPKSTIDELVETMDVFLQSPNREIVRSTLGFVKVAVISFPSDTMAPRLKRLVPDLLKWSHEHKARLQAKVKHIIERMIRRFGAEEVEKCTPEQDRRLIANIRKTRERRKKKLAEGDTTTSAGATQKPLQHDSAFDQAVYGSEDDDSDSDIIIDGDDGASISSHSSGDEASGRQRRSKHGGGGASGSKRSQETYILEDEAEPLDLLSRKALSAISTTRPLLGGRAGFGGLAAGGKPRRKAKVDEAGKLVFAEEQRGVHGTGQGLGAGDDDDALMRDVDAEAEGMGSVLGGVGAYVAAIKGREGMGMRRGRGGKVKFGNRRADKGEGEDEETAGTVGGGGGMDVDGKGAAAGKTPAAGRGKRFDRRGEGERRGGGRGGGGHGARGRGRAMSGRGGLKKAKMQRKGLGIEKTRGGRVVKR